MSVAFRRDSDEEHLEPRFELPIPVGPNLVTQRGLGLIVDRVRALELLVAAAEAGPVAEGFKRDLRYWNTRLSTAEVTCPVITDRVCFGSRVTFTLNGRHRVVDIVGHDEAEPVRDRLSFSAPLSRALLGAQVGDSLDFAGKPDMIDIIAVDVIAD